jgi:hypothetical protein
MIRTGLSNIALAMALRFTPIRARANKGQKRGW